MFFFFNAKFSCMLNLVDLQWVTCWAIILKRHWPPSTFACKCDILCIFITSIRAVKATLLITAGEMAKECCWSMTPPGGCFGTNSSHGPQYAICAGFGYSMSKNKKQGVYMYSPWKKIFLRYSAMLKCMFCHHIFTKNVFHMYRILFSTYLRKNGFIKHFP